MLVCYESAGYLLSMICHSPCQYGIAPYPSAVISRSAPQMVALGVTMHAPKVDTQRQAFQPVLEGPGLYVGSRDAHLGASPAKALHYAPL